MHAACTPLARPFPFWAVLLALVGWDVLAAESSAMPKPLPVAHAHNDYRHDRPLQGALDHGFCSIEADVYLVDGRLLVGHDREELRPERTLESLYLAPLRDRVAGNEGRVYPNGPPVFLLIDVKSEAEPTYAAIHRLLAQYEDILSTVRDGEFEQKAVTAVISGNRDERSIRGQTIRYAGIDGRPSDLDRDEPPHVLPWISENWIKLFHWTGDGPMPADERTKLRDYVAQAHAHGRLVRFWATPEDETVWKELLAAKIDLIGTDDLPRLQCFLIAE